MLNNILSVLLIRKLITAFQLSDWHLFSYSTKFKTMQLISHMNTVIMDTVTSLQGSEREVIPIL